MPNRNIGLSQTMLDRAVHGWIETRSGHIVRFRQAHHQVACHLLSATDTEGRGNVKDS
jgi:hypothetical protein